MKRGHFDQEECTLVLAIRFSPFAAHACGDLTYDQMLAWRIGWFTAYSVFKDTIIVLNKSLSIPGLSLRDEQK